MATSVLKEFLVALGWDVDERGYKDFIHKVDGATKFIEEIGAVAVASSTALGTLLVKTAHDMENLYFSAQKAGTSVGSLFAARFAGSQIGIGADAIAADLEQMGSSIRSNPGLLLFFKQLGLPVLGDNVKNMTNLVTKLKEYDSQYGHALAAQIAAQFGIDEPTLQLLFKNLPTWLASQEKLNSMAAEAGIDLQKNAELSTVFSQKLNTLWTGIELIGIAFENTLLPYAIDLIDYLQKGVDWMLQLSKATNGWSSVMAAVATSVVTIVGAFGALKGLLAIFGIGGGGAAVAAAGEGAAGILGGGALATIGTVIAGVIAGAVAVALAYYGIKAGVGYYEGHSAQIGGAAQSVESYIAHFEASAGKAVLQAYKDSKGYSIGFGHNIKPGEDFSGGISDAKAAALLVQDTATAEAAVRRLVSVALNSNQLSALTDFVYNLGPGTLQNSTLLKKLNSGDYSGASAEFERFNHVMLNGHAQTVDALTTRRQSERDLFNNPNVTINQSTEINVHGSGDPNETGTAVAREQKRVNGDIVRNMAGNVQ